MFFFFSFLFHRRRLSPFLVRRTASRSLGRDPVTLNWGMTGAGDIRLFDDGLFLGTAAIGTDVPGGSRSSSSGHIGSAGRRRSLRVALLSRVWPPANRAVLRPPTNRSPSRYPTIGNDRSRIPDIRGRTRVRHRTSCITRYFNA